MPETGQTTPEDVDPPDQESHGRPAPIADLAVSRRGGWRNIHDGASPQIEVRLAVDGDEGRSTLTRAWSGENFGDSRGELKRPGHGRTPADEAPWAQALTDFRPFLSYVDLDRMIHGRPAELYDAVNVILGLGDLGAAGSRLREEESGLRGQKKQSDTELAALKTDLWELPDEGRAIRALEAFDAPGGPDLDALTELLATLPADDDGCLAAELRLVARLRGPDPTQVEAAVGRLRSAAETVEATRATDTEDALHRADLLADALAHHLFGDAGRAGEVYRELARLCGGWDAVDIVQQCQSGAHASGAPISERRLVPHLPRLPLPPVRDGPHPHTGPDLAQRGRRPGHPPPSLI